MTSEGIKLTQKVIFLERQVPVKDGVHYSHYMSPNGDELDTVELLFAGRMHLMHNKMMPSDPGTIHIRSADQYIQFIFVIDTPRVYQLDGPEGSIVEVPELHQMAFFLAENSSISFTWDQVSRHDIFEINIGVDYLLERLPHQHFMRERLLKAINGRQSAYLFDRPMGIGPRLKTLLYDIHYCQLEGLAREMYIEAKLLELFALQQARFERFSVVPESLASVPTGERERMLEVRDFLINHPDQTISLKELARMFGTNDCYLKQHFKQTFGTTVFGYVKQLRMEKARKLLLQDQKKVSEIAQIVGYKHANHFSSAFKKYYGYTPNALL